MNRKSVTFADMEMQKRLKRFSNHTLMKLLIIIDWVSLEKILSKADLRNTNNYGRDSYSPLIMFKIMLLQKFYDLSDAAIEERLYFDYLFMHFAGISTDMPIPDESTICRWRKRFLDQDIIESAFAEFNRQLSQNNIVLNSGAIIDATLVASQARPRKQTIITVEPTGDEELPTETPHIEVECVESVDSEARWVKKGKKSLYGYKSTNTTNFEGFVSSVHTTPANVPDCKLFKTSIAKANLESNSLVAADKGYDSAENREFLESNNLKDAIMRKKKRNSDENFFNKLRNKFISKFRYPVERTFGSLKNRFGYRRSRYIGLKKTHQSNVLGATAYNLVRFANIL